MTSMHTMLRRLAEVAPGEFPVLSIYLDMRLYAPEETPPRHASLLVLAKRLEAIEQSFLPRGAALDSVRTDISRITEYLERDFAPDVQGLAIFACAGTALFEVCEAPLPFEPTVAIGAQPDLFQLARLLDAQETAVVALFENTIARLFVVRHGRLDAIGGPEHGEESFGQQDVTGWNQEQFQRHTNAARAHFAHEVAENIDHLVTRTGATRVILAGDALAIPHLKKALSQHATALIHDEAVPLEASVSQRAIEAAVDAVMLAAQREQARSTVERLVDAVRGDRLGVVGLGGTRAALERGQVDTLLLDPEAPITDEMRSDLVRLAALADSHVEVVAAYEPFRQLGGIGALLRYRLRWPEHENFGPADVAPIRSSAD
jgi:peptide subunit release factor 1 (eRF1)